MDMKYSLLAQDEFRRATLKARRSKLLSRLRGRNDDLLSLHESKNAVRIAGESYIGCKCVPVSRIVGSEDRTADFNRDFNPRKRFMEHRWVSVDGAYYDGISLPPVNLIELDGRYFVRDGHHRISVAKAHRIGFIDAEVTRIDIAVSVADVELGEAMDPVQILRKAA